MSDKITLTTRQYQQIRDHALLCYPEECCGFLHKDNYIPCANIHEKAENNFKFRPEDVTEYFPNSTAIVHSHCRNKKYPSIFNPITPTWEDIQNQRQTNKPWLIVATDGENVTLPLQFPRIPNDKYLGREFIWFVNDCYTLVQDWFRFEKGIILRDYVLKQNYQEIRHMNEIFAPHIEEYGFEGILFSQLSEGDLVLLDNGGFKQNHLGIFTQNKILHQDLVSRTEPFEHFIGRINKVLRYVN